MGLYGDSQELKNGYEYAIRKRIAKILRVEESSEEVESGYEHAIQYELDDCEVDEVQELRALLEKLRDKTKLRETSGQKLGSKKGKGTEKEHIIIPEIDEKVKVIVDNIRIINALKVLEKVKKD